MIFCFLKQLNGCRISLIYSKKSLKEICNLYVIVQKEPHHLETINNY